LDNFGSLQINNVLTLEAIPIDDCFPFETWTLDGPVFTTGFTGTLTSTIIEVRIADVNVVTATFTEDFLEPTLVDNGPVCEDEMFDVTLSGTDIVFPADATFDIGTGSQTATVDADGGVLFQADDLDPDDYVFTLLELFDANGCRLEAPMSFTFTVNPLPIISGISAEDVCEGEDVLPILSWTDSDPANVTPTFAWTAESGTFGDATVEAPVLEGAVAGNHNMSLTVTNFYGCSTTVTGTYTVNPLPTPTIAVDAEYCADAVIEPTVSGANFGTAPEYLWTIGTLTSTLASPTFGPLSAGDYVVEVSVTNSETECVGIATAPFTVNPLPVPSVAVTEVCEDDIASVTVSGTDFTEADSTFDWEIVDGPSGTSSGSATFDLPSLDAGTYTIVVTVTNEFGCIGVDTEVFTVNPLPYAEIDAPEEVCFDNNITKGFFFAQLVNIADLDAPYTITWTITGPEGTDDVVQNSPDDGITIDIADFAFPYVTGQIITVVAHLENEFGCEFTTDPVDILVLERPWIINNDILAPQVGETEKIVFCNIPKDLVKLKGDGEPEINDLASCVDDPADASIIFQWQWRFLGETTWNPAAGDNNKADYELPRHTSSVQYRRLAKAVGCDCDSDAVEWWPSNVITLHIVPSISALPTATDDVCFDEDATIDITGNIMTIEEYGPDGEPTGVTIPYVTGEWTLPAGIVFAEGFDADDAEATIQATGPGLYEVEWTLTAEDFVYTECLTEGYCCEYEVTGDVEVVFEEITLNVTANFGLDAEYCADADEVVLALPEIITVPQAALAEVLFTEDFEGTVTGWTVADLSGTGEVWTFGDPIWSQPTPPVIAGNYAIANSDGAGPGVDVETSLTSPAIDLTGIADFNILELSFGHYYYHLGSSSAMVQVSPDGSTWTTLETYTASTPIEFVAFELEDFEGEDELYIRFVYDDGGSYAWYWIVDNITVTHIPEAELDYTLTMNDVPMVAVDGDYIFDPAEEGPGVYTFVFTATSPIGCVASYTGSVEVFEVPVISYLEGVADFCEYDDTEIDLTAYVSSSIASGTWTFSGVGVTGDVWVADDAGVGTHVITAEFVADAGGCEDEITFEFEVYPQPEVLAIAVDPASAPAQWTDPFNLWVHHDLNGVVTIETIIDLPGGATYTYEVTESSSTWFPPVGATPGFWRTIFNIDPQDADGYQLNVNNDFFAVVVTNPADGLYCESDEFGPETISLEVPPYAVFHPTYDVVWDDPGNDPIPNVPIDVDLTIEFSENIFDGGGLPLTDVSLGDLITIREYPNTSTTTFTELNKVVQRTGNKVFITLLDSPGGDPMDFEYSSLYRLDYVAVTYKRDGVDPEDTHFAWRLDGTTNVNVPADEQVPGAFYESREIWFETEEMPLEPYVLYELFPDPYCVVLDDDEEVIEEAVCQVSVCDEIKVEFTNPIKFREEAYISDAITSKLTHKFKVEKWDGSAWVLVNFHAVPGDFYTFTEGPHAGNKGPREIVIEILDDDNNPVDMEFATDYRISERDGQEDFGPGFEDMVTGDILMGEDEDIDVPFGFELPDGNHWANNMTLGTPWFWEWTTTDEYDINFALDTYETFHNLANFNRMTVDGEDVIMLNASDVPYVSTPTYTVDYNGTFDVSAIAGEGYYFVEWHKSYDGGATFSALPTSDPTPLDTGVIGVDYMPQTTTLNGDEIFPICGQDIVYKPVFEKYEYDIATVVAEDCDGLTVFSLNGTVEYGDFVELEVAVDVGSDTSKGYVFTGWTLPSYITGNVTVTYETTYEEGDEYEGIKPITTAMLKFWMIDTSGEDFGAEPEDVYNEEFEFSADCKEFIPKIWAATQGVDIDGETVLDPNLTNILFQTVFVENILQTGRDPEVDWDDYNEYQWAAFRYGNPNPYPPIVFSEIQVNPLDVPCWYEWLMWERYIPETDTWEELTDADGIIYSFVPTENYILRATFIWRDDILVSIANDEDVVDDADAMATITHKNLRTGETWDSDETAKPYRKGDEIEITVYPESAYMTYGWVDAKTGLAVHNYNSAAPEDGGMIDGEGFPNRNQYRTVWRYVVGCEDIDLRAVIAKKRFAVTAEVYPNDMGTIIDFMPEFQVDHPIVIDGDDHLFGYWPEDQLLGFETIPEDAEEDEIIEIAGYFEKNTPISVEVLARESEEDEDIIFLHWTENGSLAATDELYTNVVTENLALVAYFADVFEPNKWQLVLEDAPEGAAEYLSAYPETLYNIYAEGQTVEVTAESVVGYDFSHWTASEDLDLTALEMEANPLTFDMPEDAPDPISEIVLTAHFVPTEYDVEAHTRTYMKRDPAGSFPYTGTVHIIGEELSTPVSGGTVTITNMDDPLEFGGEVTVHATVKQGFRLINFMVGNVNSYKAIEGIQINPTDDDFVNWNNGTGESTFTFTVPFGDDLDIWFDEDDTIHIYAIFGETGNEEFPAHQLVTGSYPEGYGLVKSDPAFTSNETADGIYAYGSVVPVSEVITAAGETAGYVFDNWTVNIYNANGTLYDSYDADILTEVTMELHQVGAWKEVIANYELDTYTLYVETIPNGYGYATPQVTTYQMVDENILVEAFVDEPDCDYTYYFIGWFADEDGLIEYTDAGGTWITDESFLFIPKVPEVGNAITIYAKFGRVTETFDVELAVHIPFGTPIMAPHGDAATTNVVAVDADGVPGAWRNGDDVQISTTPNPNGAYLFQHWVDYNGVITDKPMTFNYTIECATVSWTAVYEYNTYDLTLLAVPEAGGTLAADPDKDDYIIHDVVEVTVVPAVGYNFVGYTITGDGITNISDDLDEDGGTIDFTWGYSDVIVEAEFVKKTYDVTVTADPVAGGTVEGAGTYDHGTEITISATPEAGFDFLNWTSNGVVVTTEEAFLYNVIADADFVANFISVDCAKPTGLTAYVTATTAYVTWDDAVVAGWEVSDDGGLTWEPAPVNARYYDDLDPESEFDYAVRAVCNISGEVYSDATEIAFSTLALGDVDGDGDITVFSDQALIIAYMNGHFTTFEIIEDAQERAEYEGALPLFIFDAADINIVGGEVGDNKINILDLVAWVNIFKDAKTDAILNSSDANIYLEKDIIRLETDGTITALQFELTGDNLDMIHMEMIATGYDLFWRVDDDILTGFIFSQDNQAFTNGLNELVEIHNAQNITWGNVFAANLNAEEVPVNARDITTDIYDAFVSDMSVEIFPNPSSGQFTSVVDVPANSKVVLRLFDVTGREFAVKQLDISGVEHVSWNEDLNPGMYILRMVATPEGLTGQTVTREVRVLIN